MKSNLTKVFFSAFSLVTVVFAYFLFVAKEEKNKKYIESPDTSPVEITASTTPITTNEFNLIYATTTKNGEELFVEDYPKNKIKSLLYKRLDYSSDSNDYKYYTHRLYPDGVTTDQMISDYELARSGSPVFPKWFGKISVLTPILPTENVASENFLLGFDRYSGTSPGWLSIPKECLGYLSGDKCMFTISSPNPYGLMKGKLNQKTGPYIWKNFVSPFAMYAVGEDRVLISWAFGDGGAFQYEFSLWDIRHDTHNLLGTILGFEGESVELNLPEKKYTFSHISDNSLETTPALRLDPFEGIEFDQRKLQKGCFTVDFHPTDVLDITAPWLVEYTYDCEEDTFKGLSVIYELNTVTDTMKRITEVIPK